MSTRGAALVSVALLMGALGCDTVASIGPDICDRSETGNPPVRYTEGTVEGGIYRSSEWSGPLLYFPGGMRYSIEHRLGEVPRFWQFYLSFDELGTETGVVALAAGNQAELRGIDDEALEVVNGSCAAYWLLVVAGVADVEGPPADEGGAGEK
jgi:hypothetical protein